MQEDLVVYLFTHLMCNSLPLLIPNSQSHSSPWHPKSVLCVCGHLRGTSVARCWGGQCRASSLSLFQQVATAALLTNASVGGFTEVLSSPRLHSRYRRTMSDHTGVEEWSDAHVDERMRGSNTPPETCPPLSGQPCPQGCFKVQVARSRGLEWVAGVLEALGPAFVQFWVLLHVSWCTLLKENVCYFSHTASKNV